MRIIKSIWLILFLLASLLASAQSPYVDSLERLIQKPIQDTVKVWALNELSREYLYGDPEQSLNLGNEALALAKKIGYKRGEAYAYRVLATISATQDEYLSYSEKLQQGIKLFIELEDSVGLGNCYITEAVVYDRQLKFQRAIDSYNSALSIFRKAKMQDRIAVCLTNMGFVYYRIKKYQDARETLLEATKINESINNKSALMGSYDNLGLVYFQLRNLQEAEKYFDKVISMNEELKGNSNTEAYVEALIGQSDIYKNQGRLSQQLRYLELAKDNAQKFQYLELTKEAYKKLIQYHLKNGNKEKAYDALVGFTIVDDSITTQKTRNEAAIITSVINSARLETDYENAQDDLLRQENVILQQEKSLIAVALVGVLFFILLVLLLLINRNRKVMNRAMDAHRIAIDKKNAELEKLNQTKDKFFSVVAHDLRSPLNSLLGFSNLLVKHTDSMTKEEIQKMGEQLKDAVGNTLKMTENLIIWARSQMKEELTRPELMSAKTAIADTLNVFSEVLAKKGIQLDSSAVDDAPVYVDKDHFSLILRNLINNAIKYSTIGGKISVKAAQENGSTVIEIADKGLGMDDEMLRKLFTLDGTMSQVGTSGERGTGLGLLLCKDFVKRNGGSLEVKSVKDSGSSFVVRLPSFNTKG